ncbi:hypothetical protein, partial [Helicobacter sp.]|uniref:hypothetical protein n=1 Tax=Helicobacter sp. TaxID=218 RepID=UPI0025BA4493
MRFGFQPFNGLFLSLIANGINAYLSYGNLQNVLKVKEQHKTIQQEALRLAKTPYDAREDFFYAI